MPTIALAPNGLKLTRVTTDLKQVSPDRAVEGVGVHVGRHPGDEVGQGDGGAVVAAVSRSLISGDLGELPGVRAQARGGHTHMSVDVGDPPVSALLVQLARDDLLAGEDYYILAADVEAGAGCLHSLVRVLDLRIFGSQRSETKNLNMNYLLNPELT